MQFVYFPISFVDIKELKTIKGLAINDIITEVHKFVLRSKQSIITLTADSKYLFLLVEFPYEILTALLDKMAEMEQRLAAGANENIQLTALISAFQYAKELHPAEDL